MTKRKQSTQAQFNTSKRQNLHHIALAVKGAKAPARRWAKAYKYFYGLSDQPEAVKVLFARRCASYQIALESYDARLAMGEEVSGANLVRLTNGLGRAVRALGISQWVEINTPQSQGVNAEAKATLKKLQGDKDK